MTRSRRNLLKLAGLLALGGLAAVALAQGPMGGGRVTPPAGGYGPGMIGGCGYGPGGYGPGGYGMMRGYGPGNPGMMRGYGPGMMGGGPGGYGMMGGTGMMQVLPQDAQPLSDDAVRSNLKAAADHFASGAQLHDIMVFTNNVYAQVLDKDGNAVAEILLDRYSGAVTPEPGPNMMWNTRFGMGAYGPGAYGPGAYGPGAYGPRAYGPGACGSGGYGYGPGMMGDNDADGAMGPGMMNGYGRGSAGAGSNAAQAPSRYDLAAATDAANAFLKGYLPGASVVGSQSFPGYYTFDYGRDGQPEGMLSVNASTAQVWPHAWHGAFIREME